MIPEQQRQLEQLVDRALRDLPPRRAPRSLEQRVLASLEQRAALPWWRKSFGYWPLAARVAFLVVCIGVAHLLVTATMWAIAGFDTGQIRAAFATPLAVLQGLFAAARAVVGFFEMMLRNLPPLWLYGALAFFATMYAALFGLGAAAYRALHVHR